MCLWRSDQVLVEDGTWRMDRHRDQLLTDCHSLPTSAAFGGVALFAVIFYASGIPRVKSDILQVRRNLCLGRVYGIG